MHNPNAITRLPNIPDTHQQQKPHTVYTQESDYPDARRNQS
jgi:hypothetical protein